MWIITHDRSPFIKELVSRSHRLPFGVVSADNLLRFAQVATGHVVLFTGRPSLLDFEVVSEVELFQTTVPTAHLNVGRVAVGSGYGVVGDEFVDLGAESTVGRNCASP